MKEKISVTGVPETIIQTLYARASESNRENPLREAAPNSPGA